MIKRIAVTLLLAIVMAGIFLAGRFLFGDAPATGRVSELGKYQGYSKSLFNGSRRRSDYLTLKDGTKLAYDLILPAKDGVTASEPLPVLFKYTPYLRTPSCSILTGRPDSGCGCATGSQTRAG
jgi:hypothetical protein